MLENKPYIVSARKYRPATFRSVVGQQTLSATLKNAIDSKKLAQAYLFCGPRGVGKTSCARIFAKTINCMNPDKDGEACGKCESCRAIDRGSSFDLVELDAASNNSVDDIRSISEQVNVPPQHGRYRVFIIDEVHMLSNSAFNAFLKTLEEPPANVVFILATTEKHKVIPTILSRCQIYDFKRITVNDMIDHLAYVAQCEGIKAEREALGVIAHKADGAMRDALSIFDRVSAATEGNITYANTLESLNVLDQEYYFRLVDMFKEGKVADTLLLYKEIRDKGFDSHFFINGLASHIRDLMVAFSQETVKLLETSEEMAKRYLSQAPSLPIGWYYEALKILNDCDLNYRTASNKRLLIELALIRLSRLLVKDKGPFESPESGLPPLPPVETIKNAVSSSGSSLESPGKQKSKAEIPSTNEKKVEEKKMQNEPKKEIAKDSRRLNRPQSFRLTDSIEESKTAYNSGTLEKRNNNFTHEEFIDAWQRFVDANQSMHILVNAMRGATPVRGEDNQYKILVDHPAQIQAFELSMNKLLTFLRDSLNNDYLGVKVDLAEKDTVPERLAPKEFLKKVIDENPILGEFIGKIEGEII